MRNYEQETEKRVEFIRGILRDAHADGVVYGNSGGKDCTLVSILCKRACPNTVGVILPCQSSRNYGEDRVDALAAAKQYDIETLEVDLTPAKEAFLAELNKAGRVEGMAGANINPRLRMTAVYALAQSRNSLVAGTGNRSESYMGYFTKWGDGGCDFNPILDLTATEVLEFLRFLGAPAHIVEKAPSAGLFEGQTDEKEMGITYRDLDCYLTTGEGDSAVVERIERAHRATEHKRRLPASYVGE